MMEALAVRILQAVAEHGPFEGDVLYEFDRNVAGWDEGITSWQYETACRSLARDGLVNLRQTPTGDKITYIEATRRGYAEVGVPEDRIAAQVGTRGAQRMLPRHATDRTDFRTHGSRAEGGEITIRKDATMMNGQTAPTNTQNFTGDGQKTKAKAAAISDKAAWVIVPVIASNPGIGPTELSRKVELSESVTNLRWQKALMNGWIRTTATGQARTGGGGRRQFYVTDLGMSLFKGGASALVQPAPIEDERRNPVVATKTLPAGAEWYASLDGAKYPLIMDVMRRASEARAWERAAKVLEEAGLIDQALALMEEHGALRDLLEREVYALIRDEIARGGVE